MRAVANRLMPVDAPEPEITEESVPSVVDKAATTMLLTALKALSHRAMVALAALEHLFLAAGVFALWWRISPAPDVLQLWTGGLFSVFVLVLVWLRRK